MELSVTQPTSTVVWILGDAFLFLGVLIAVGNFYLSFLRYPLHRLLWPTREYHWVSGAPVLGTVFTVLGVVLLRTGWAVAVGLAALLLDTGGLPWFAGVMVCQFVKDWRTRN